MILFYTVIPTISTKFIDFQRLFIIIKMITELSDQYFFNPFIANQDQNNHFFV